MSDILEHRIVSSLRTFANSYVPGDQVAPCALLWLDPERLWTSVLPRMQSLIPELFALGPYSPSDRTGPALWLRCVEVRVLADAPPKGTTPIFYLPGVGKDQLRAADECPPEWAALVELQYRGASWLHANGKEWTPNSFLVSTHGGLGLDVPKDRATQAALIGALPTLLKEPLSHLEGRRLDADFFNGLLAPDTTGYILRWLADSEGFKQQRSSVEWKAFCQQCKTEFHFHPEKDGPLKAARLMAAGASPWNKVWHRFEEAPHAYEGVVTWLERAAPEKEGFGFGAEVWPTVNASEEKALKEALAALVDRPQHEAIEGVAELERRHGPRRAHVWKTLGRSPMATVLEPLADLAEYCRTTPGGATSAAFAEFYAAEGWRVDAAALATLEACGTAEQNSATLALLRAIYMPWLEVTARHLQLLLDQEGRNVPKQGQPLAATAGRLVLFADGLRMDVAHQLVKALSERNIEVARDWEWSTVPSVTASAKPAASPIAAAIQGSDNGAAFGTRLAGTKQPLTQDRFVTKLTESGWQVLGPGETGDPAGAAWTESGALDKRGHNEGWKLARSVATEVKDLASRIQALLQAGWKELIVVTDHGWLLMPQGLPKVELKAFLTEDRWGRCATLKAGANTDPVQMPWSWNPEVVIASPSGVGCYLAGVEYSHGGISLQEMVTPILRIGKSTTSTTLAKLATIQWIGAKCKVSVSGAVSNLRVDIRTVHGDLGTTLLGEDGARTVSAEGKVNLYLDDDGYIGRRADIVLIDAHGQVIDSRPATYGTE